MEFLCPTHRRQVADLPLKERKDLWLFWMENAHACSELAQWRDVISLSGSAFDLACLQGTSDDGTCMHIELTLSAILVCRVLSDRGDSAAKERILFRALGFLQENLSARVPRECCGLEECLIVLVDPSRQVRFFKDYLNWPTLPFGPGTTSFSRVLH